MGQKSAGRNKYHVFPHLILLILQKRPSISNVISKGSCINKVTKEVILKRGDNKEYFLDDIT